jgi:hypothetical protein
MNNLASAVLPRTLLIHRQYCQLSKAFSSAGIPFILLKGVALIESLPHAMRIRNMEDMDIMVPKEKLSDARELLSKLGYWPAPQDPCAHIHISQPVAIDLIDRLWYLTNLENEELWISGSTLLPNGGRILNPVDFYVHVFAHGAIHHANSGNRWKEDLALIDNRWHVIGLPALNQRLRMLGWEELHNFLIKGKAPHGLRTRFMLGLASPKAGYIARALMLRNQMLLGFLQKTIFPDTSFIRGRYNAQSWWQVCALRALRPFVLCKEVFCALINRPLPISSPLAGEDER